MLERTSLRFQAVCFIGGALLLAGCRRDGDVIGSATLPNIAGKFVIEDDDRTVALSAVQHSVFYVLGDTRELIFQGSGAQAPALSLLAPNNILIRYCGGRVEKIESSFFENKAKVGNEGAELRILRVQAVTGPGLTANGEEVCVTPADRR